MSLVLRSTRLKKVNATLSTTPQTFSTSTSSIISKNNNAENNNDPSSFSGYYEAPEAYQLCFSRPSDDSYSILRRYFTNPAEDGSDFSDSSLSEWFCEGYLDPWRLKATKWCNGKPCNTVNTQVNGYLFRTLKNNNDCFNNRWTNTNGVDTLMKVGPGFFVVVSTTSQINSYNNPSSNRGFKSISKFILDYCDKNKNNQVTPEKLFPRLIHDEEIYYIEPVESPLTCDNTYTILTNKEEYEFDLSKLIKTNCQIPFDDFEFGFFSSSNNSVGEIQVRSRKIIIKIKTKTTGTFDLSATQLFYQSKTYNKSFYKKEFKIKIEVKTEYSFDIINRIKKVFDEYLLYSFDIDTNWNRSFASIYFDSLALIEITQNIEKEFNISISNEDAEQLETVNKLYHYINKKVN
jgi:acyl carrier protein